MHQKHGFFILLLLIPFIHCHAWIEDKIQVRITNQLYGKKELKIHCKSKNDDLKVHILSYNEEYMFVFKPNFFLTTLFFCGFVWDDKLHWFDIYVQERDDCLDNECSWVIRDSGPCLLGRGGVIRNCYVWNKNVIV